MLQRGVLARWRAGGDGVGDKTARLWEAASGKELAVLRGHEGRCRARCSRPMARGW